MADSDKTNNKVKALFTGKRPFPKRLLLAAAPSLSLSFTLLFFGPLDLACVSRDYLTWSPLDILPVTALVFGCCFLVLLLAASVPGGKVHAFFISAFTGISLAMYLQGAFLNPDLGTLDGRTINWPGYSGKMIINLVIWFVILQVPYLIHYLSNRAWRFFVILVSLTIVLMQGVSLTIKLVDRAKADRERPEDYFLSIENMLTVGSEKNIAVFLLDTTSNGDVSAMLEKYPEALLPFHDFTRYDNANSLYMFTVPSLVSMLTGSQWDCENDPILNYMNNAWHTEKASSFYQTLEKKGYERNFYMLLSETVDDPSFLREAASNLRSSGGDRKIDRRAFLKLVKLSCYRYFPLALKPFFVIYTTDLTNLAAAEDAFLNEWDFVERMNNSGLAVGKAKNIFNFYYLAGTHKPYRMDERGRYINSDAAPEFLTNYSEMEDQLSGFFFLINDYMRQLKEKGLYDETGIIILADHGNNAEIDADRQPVYFVKMPGERHDEMVIRSAPVTVQEVLIPDILLMSGEEADRQQPPSALVPDGPAERRTRIYAADPAYPELPGSGYNVMHEYRYTGDGETLREMWSKGEYLTIPMIDSFY